MITRAGFLKLMALGGAGFLAPEWSFAQPAKGGRVNWARLKFPCVNHDLNDWNAHPQGDVNLIKSLEENTTINVVEQWQVASIDDLSALTRYPFLFMHAELPPEFDDQQCGRLREYLTRGGFLFAEDCVIGKRHHGDSSGTSDRFFRGAMELLPRVLPEAKIIRLPDDHEIYHCYHHLENGLPHMQGTPHGGYGVYLGERLVAFLSPSDLHCGWTHGDQWFGPAKTQKALQMGTNIYVYAMTH